MKNARLFFGFLLCCSLMLAGLAPVYSQEKGKGDLEDFADDYGEEESDDDESGDSGTDFFLYLLLDNIVDVAQLWGGTPGTAVGPYPSFPYQSLDGFMHSEADFRSYYFNTEFDVHYLNENLRSYLFKWETQFAHSSKLSFDVAVYEEDLVDREFGGTRKDHLTFFGVRYGHALYRSPQIILNLEAGFRGFQRNAAHGGPEIALDLQLFPKRPLILETEIAAAYVSNGALYTVESSAGVAIDRFEVLGGIRILKNKSQDLLDGFRIGLRVWY